MTISLNERLLSLNADVLKGWLRRVGAFDKSHTRKEDFVRAIEQQLTLNLPQIVAQLSEAEQTLLAESAHQGRLISEREFSAKYGSPRPMPKGHYYWEEKVSLLAPFIHLGDYRISEPPGLVPSLMESLRGLLPKPEGLEVRGVSGVPKAWPSERQALGGDRIRPIHVFESERIAPTELGRVLRLIQGGRVKVTDATRRPTDATTRLIGETLIVPDCELCRPEDDYQSDWARENYLNAGPVRAHAWPVLVQQCGWAKSKGGTLVLTEAGKEMLQRFTPENLRAGLECYFANGDFDELSRVNHIRGQSGKAKRYLSDPALRKLAVEVAMEGFPVGQWLKFEQAQRIIEAAESSWEVLGTDRPVLYFFEPQFGFITDNTGLGRQFLRVLFMESLATLGVLDIAFVYPHELWPDLHDSLGGDLPFCGRYDGLLYVRLNALGAFALGFADHYELQAQESPKLFRILPNHDLEMAPGILNPSDRAMLELLAKPKSDSAWTLDAGKMLAHVENGGEFRELGSFLETNAVEAMPGNVRAFLGELEQKLRACTARREAVLLEWQDAALAQFIATNPATNKLCFHAGGNRLVVPKEHLTAFGRAVKKLGYVLPPRAAS